MPVFEFRCSRCGKKFSKLIGMTADSTAPACPTCGTTEVKKLISRFSRIKSDDERLDDFEDAAFAAEDDPRAARRLMSEMGKELGEDSDEDFDELIDEAEGELSEDGDVES